MQAFKPYAFNMKGKVLDLSQPQVMGILNVTPDSFYAGSRKQSEKEITERIEQIWKEGAGMIDIGAYSSRPNADDVSPQEEMERLRTGLELLKKSQCNLTVSVDTFRADVARMCVEEYGVHIINDISGGALDPDMFTTVAKLDVPYILMHMKGTPQTMQQNPHYDHVVKEVYTYFEEKISQLRALGVKDIILDPGFGFAKTLHQNYQLMQGMEAFHQLQLPLLVGISRKSMIYKLLNTNPSDALNGTTVLNTYALLKGAHILRVHDVKECVEAIKLTQAIRTSYV